MSLEKEINSLKEAVDNFSISEFNPSADAVNAVLQRKAGQLKTNTSATRYHKTFARQDKSEFHNAHPNASTQDRYDYQGKHQAQVNKFEQQSKSLNDGAKRIAKWVKGNVNSGNTKREAVKDAHSRMVAAGRENEHELVEAISVLKEQFNSIFEVEEKEAPKEENKVKTVKKDKNGKEVELVSVEDELFPYDGTAKEQMQKKIIDKINDMIQGQATLQDLIHLVRQKKVSENFDEVMRMGVRVLEMLEPVDEISKEK